MAMAMAGGAARAAGEAAAAVAAGEATARPSPPPPPPKPRQRQAAQSDARAGQKRLRDQVVEDHVRCEVNAPSAVPGSGSVAVCALSGWAAANAQGRVCATTIAAEAPPTRPTMDWGAFCSRDAVLAICEHFGIDFAQACDHLLDRQLQQAEERAAAVEEVEEEEEEEEVEGEDQIIPMPGQDPMMVAAKPPLARRFTKIMGGKNKKKIPTYAQYIRSAVQGLAEEGGSLLADIAEAVEKARTADMNSPFEQVMGHHCFVEGSFNSALRKMCNARELEPVSGSTPLRYQLGSAPPHLRPRTCEDCGRILGSTFSYLRHRGNPKACNSKMARLPSAVRSAARTVVAKDKMRENAAMPKIEKLARRGGKLRGELTALARLQASPGSAISLCAEQLVDVGALKKCWHADSNLHLTRLHRNDKIVFYCPFVGFIHAHLLEDVKECDNCENMIDKAIASGATLQSINSLDENGLLLESKDQMIDFYKCLMAGAMKPVASLHFKVDCVFLSPLE
jgi:hypothetical protein